MRVPLIFLWARAARHDPARRPAARDVHVDDRHRAGVLGDARDPGAADRQDLRVHRRSRRRRADGPFIAERRKGGTPWHAHHIAERYGLLVIITLGEGVIGTVATINALVHGDAGWTVEAGVVAFAGIALIFATWWTYFLIPWAHVLSLHRERSFLWGYGHIVIFASLAAIGGGLHVAAYYIEHESELGATGTVLSTAIPFGIYTSCCMGSTHRSPVTQTRSIWCSSRARRRCSCLRRPRVTRCECRRLPRRPDAGSRRDRGRLRDRRPPAHRGVPRADDLTE